MASKSENAEIAVLQDQMGTVKADVNEIKGDVKTILNGISNMPLVYVSIESFENFKREQKNKNIINIVGTVLITGIISGLIYLAFGVN